MHTPSQKLSRLHRPILLTRAARTAMPSYNRSRDLAGISGVCVTSKPEYRISQLFNREYQLDCARTENDPDYCVREHIRVLTALMSEIPMLLHHANAA